MTIHPVKLAIIVATAWVVLGCSSGATNSAPESGGAAGAFSMNGGAPGSGGSAGNVGTPPVTGNGGIPPITGNGGALPIGGNGGAPPIGGNGGAPPIGGNGGAPPVGGNGGAPPIGGNGGITPVGGASGASGMGTGGTVVSSDGKPPADKLPKVNGACPPMTTGTATVNGTPAHIWAGTKPGPAYIYWHATGTAYTEVMQGMPGATGAVGTAGGFVVSFDSTNSKGTNTGNGVWFTGDLESADQVLACAIEKGIVDTSRIYTAGYSAGGLQACAMVAQRSKYLAAAICYSGGAAIIQGTPTDKSNLPAVLLLHGGMGKDTFILDFFNASQSWGAAYVKAGGFAIMKFFQAHTFGLKPEPYSPLPADWPMYCQIMK
jgi:hypothetical protein